MAARETDQRRHGDARLTSTIVEREGWSRCETRHGRETVWAKDGRQRGMGQVVSGKCCLEDLRRVEVLP